MLLQRIKSFPLGYSEARYKNATYGVTKTDFNNGKSIKLYAEELGGRNYISLNYYITSNSELLIPCEMSKEKVLHFLNNYLR